jgi:transglutaminase-like putative cysteine protease
MVHIRPSEQRARIGRVLIARGRDAADVAIATTFGPNTLESFNIWTDEVAESGAYPALNSAAMLNMSLLTVRHVTIYRYSEPVRLGEHRMMFRPRESHDLKLLRTSLTITPNPARLRWLHDVFDNSIAIAEFDGFHFGASL